MLCRMLRVRRGLLLDDSFQRGLKRRKHRVEIGYNEVRCDKDADLMAMYLVARFLGCTHPFGWG